MTAKIALELIDGYDSKYKQSTSRDAERKRTALADASAIWPSVVRRSQKG